MADQRDTSSKECPPQHPLALCLIPQGSGQGTAQPGAVGGSSDVPRWPHGAVSLSQHTGQCHSTRSPGTPSAPTAGSGGTGNHPRRGTGRGTATAPLRAPGKGHAAPAATPRQVEAGRRQQPAGCSKGKRIFAQERSP